MGKIKFFKKFLKFRNNLHLLTAYMGEGLSRTFKSTGFFVAQI